jgi:hypothetical protein
MQWQCYSRTLPINIRNLCQKSNDGFYAKENIRIDWRLFQFLLNNMKAIPSISGIIFPPSPLN